MEPYAPNLESLTQKNFRTRFKNERFLRQLCNNNKLFLKLILRYKFWIYTREHVAERLKKPVISFKKINKIILVVNL